jgi:hypothetical protein
MYKYLVAFVLMSPLIGIWLVEHGEYAGSIGVTGSANGATIAFAAYALTVAVVAIAVCGVRVHRKPAPLPLVAPQPGAGREYIHFSKNLLLLSGTFLLLMLFGFGGINVWLGTIEKGLFRATLGPFAAFPYLLTKFAVPALFAYSTMLLTRTNRSRSKRLLWWANAFLVLLVGSTWGFKTTGIFMMLPALLILNWHVSIWRLAKIGLVFLGSLVLFFFWFDAPLLQGTGVVAFLATRLTVLQGDVAWYVWGLYRDAQTLPNYWPTLLAVTGDTMLRLFGISRENQIEWMGYHYDWMVTHLAGVPLDAIADGHSLTATPFAEGLVAGGVAGVALFAVLAGLLVGRAYFYLDRAIRRRYSATAAILATYFCFHIFSWLNGGAITQLVHISTAIYLIASVLLIKWMSLSPRGSPAPVSTAPLAASGALAGARKS